MQEKRPHQRAQTLRQAKPGRIALLWLIYAVMLIVDAVLLPQEWVSSVIFQSGTPIFAGLLAGWALRLRGATLGLVAALCTVAIAAQAIRLAWMVAAEFRADAVPDRSVFNAAAIGVVIAFVWKRYAARARTRRLAAVALVGLANLGASAFAHTDELFLRASQEAQYLLQASVPDAKAEEPDPMAGIASDTLWEAQQALIAKEAGGLQPRVAGRDNIYAIAVAAGGSQQLFSREARLALDVAARRFGGTYRGGILLSNGTADLLKRPLASRTNFVAAARDVSAHIGPDRTGAARDVALIYLAAHGSQDALLQTDLPNYEDLTPISAASVAKALKSAGIKRRIIIISAYYSGSWIPALADPDTIIVTAAAKDRTSFGCDDSRDVTYFGEAFLKGPLAHGSSFKDAFKAAQAKIAGWEKAEKLDPSRPQAYVGRNMRDIWETWPNGGRGRD